MKIPTPPRKMTHARDEKIKKIIGEFSLLRTYSKRTHTHTHTHVRGGWVLIDDDSDDDNDGGGAKEDRSMARDVLVPLFHRPRRIREIVRRGRSD